jgi:prepilin-type N-terminal cleavage/methylation domain-containing protein
MGFYSLKKDAGGFTLIELVVVIVVVGIVAAYAMMKNSSAAVYTLLSQAQTMAADVRHTQSLATTWGRRLRITAVAGSNGTFSVSCVTAGASPCDTSPVINPSTGTAFTTTLKEGVVLAGPATLDIDSLGKPSAAATYTVSSSGSSINVNVAAITGLVVVAP